MIYVRSILAGIAAVVVAALTRSFIALLLPTIKYGLIGDTWNVFNPLSALARWLLPWYPATIIVGAGFSWESQTVSSQGDGNLSQVQRRGKPLVVSVSFDSHSEVSRAGSNFLAGEVGDVISRRG